jgi:2,4-dienoyl-CoA reductase (NADPH2)
VNADETALFAFDEIVLATGVKPRIPAIDGIGHASVVSYVDVLNGTVETGGRVALIGAGGIGFDVAEYLSHDVSGDDHPHWPTPGEFARQWGIDMSLRSRGGVLDSGPCTEPSSRQIWLLQRKTSKPGKNLGKTTGWTHRLSLSRRGVKMIPGVNYRRIDDDGLHVEVDGSPQVLDVDHVVVCAGQESRRELLEPLRQAGKTVHLIGGADLAAELDAKRAIRQGAELAAMI